MGWPYAWLNSHQAFLLGPNLLSVFGGTFILAIYTKIVFGGAGLSVRVLQSGASRRVVASPVLSFKSSPHAPSWVEVNLLLEVG